MSLKIEPKDDKAPLSDPRFHDGSDDESNHIVTDAAPNSSRTIQSPSMSMRSKFTHSAPLTTSPMPSTLRLSISILSTPMTSDSTTPTPVSSTPMVSPTIKVINVQPWESGSYTERRCQYSPIWQGDYNCLFPCCCAKPFRRQCDLKRHYEIAHPAPGADQNFLCDYPGCSRGKMPFARRAYFRDHLKEQHKEAIKHGRRKEGLTCSERTSNESWWRCGRCLKRIYFETQGYDCTSCKTKPRAQRSRNKVKPPVDVGELKASME